MFFLVFCCQYPRFFKTSFKLFCNVYHTTSEISKLKTSGEHAPLLHGKRLNENLLSTKYKEKLEELACGNAASKWIYQNAPSSHVRWRILLQVARIHISNKCINILTADINLFFIKLPGAKVCTQCEGGGVNTQDHYNGQFKAGGLCWLCRYPINPLYPITICTEKCILQYVLKNAYYITINQFSHQRSC